MFFPRHAFEKTLFGGLIDRQAQEADPEAALLWAGLHALQTHHAVILDDVGAGQIIGNGANPYITSPVAVATAGTLGADLGEP
jgi:hypothetical protein